MLRSHDEWSLIFPIKRTRHMGPNHEIHGYPRMGWTWALPLRRKTKRQQNLKWDSPNSRFSGFSIGISHKVLGVSVADFHEQNSRNVWQVWRQLMERYLNTETAFDPLNACNFDGIWLDQTEKCVTYIQNTYISFIYIYTYMYKHCKHYFFLHICKHHRHYLQ